MKSYIRLLSIFTVLLLLCVSLTGCDALDEARAAQGFWRESDILLNGNLYKPAPSGEYLYPEFDRFESYIHVTADDVPVLLSIFGDLYYISDNHLFLEDEKIGTLYCRADVYEEIADKLVNGFEPKAYCYWSYEYDKEEETVYTLTDDETLVIASVMASVEPTVMPAGVSLDYTHWAQIYACTADHLLRKYVYDVVEMDGAYYISYSDEIETRLYTVPAKHAAVFHHILEVQCTADESWDAWYEDEWESDYDL